MENSLGIELSDVQRVEGVEHLNEFVRNTDPELLRFETFNVPIERILLADNIRPFDNQFIEVLATSIERHGQMQPCIGDIIHDDNEAMWVRLIAGQHRFKAIERLNSEGKRIPVKINIANQELDPYHVIEIQITENLHNKMTLAQEARVINGLYQKTKELKYHDQMKFSVSEFAKSVSRSPDTVRDAIKFVEGLSPTVQKLVDNRILSYSMALLLTDVESILKNKTKNREQKEGINMEITKEEIYWNQLRIAQTFVVQSFTFEKAKKYMERQKAESNFVGTLFGEQEEEKAIIKDHMIKIKNESDKRGRDSAGWLAKIVHMINLMPEPMRAELSDAVKNGVLEAGDARDVFMNRFRSIVGDEKFERTFANKSGLRITDKE